MYKCTLATEVEDQFNPNFLIKRPTFYMSNKPTQHTKAHQVTNLMDNFGMSRAQATRVVDSVIGDIEKAVIAGKEVRVAGVGTIYSKTLPARTRTNPQTGESYQTTEKKRIAFRQSKAGQTRLNELAYPQ